jgi:hypothetical protein
MKWEELIAEARAAGVLAFCADGIAVAVSRPARRGAKAMESGTQEKKKVEWTVSHDRATGLAINVFQWCDATGIRIQVEVANRFIDYIPLTALPYDNDIDGARAERRRVEIEASLSSALGVGR